MLKTEPCIERPDNFYETLLSAHQDLTTEQSHDLNARLVLILANQVGRFEVLQAALAAARGNLDRTMEGAPQ